jgi:hypothetical protein
MGGLSSGEGLIAQVCEREESQANEGALLNPDVPAYPRSDYFSPRGARG